MKSSLGKYGIVLDSLSAEEASTLDERGLPKGLGRQYRRVQVASDGYNQDAHTVSMAVSSETPVARYYGEEILSHAKGALRTDRLKQGVALLFNHSMDQHLGRSVDFKLTDTGLQVTSRFGENPLALEKELDVRTGILVDVSIGYFVHAWDIVEDTKTGFRTYTATDWEIYEISLVTVPADPTVGVGRSLAAGEPEPKFNLRKVGEEAARSEDDEDDDEEEEDDATAEERAASTTSSESTTNSEAKRTPTMADIAVGTDLAVQNAERITGLRSIRSAQPNLYSEDQLLNDIASNADVRSVKDKVADAVIKAGEAHAVRTADDPLSGMSEKEKKSYSLRNIYAHAVNKRNPGTFSDKGAEAGFEREYSATLKKEAGTRGFSDFGEGIVVPSFLPFDQGRAAQQRSIAAGGPVGAVSIVPTIEGSPIEILRSRTITLALGARYMTGMFGTPRMLRQNSSGTSSWLLEQGVGTFSDIGFDFIQMSPKRNTMMNSYFLEFLAQSPIAIEDMLRDDRNQLKARTIDAVGVAGPGTNGTPLGLLGQTGLAAVLTGGVRNADGTVTAGVGNKPMSYYDCTQFEGAISTANGDTGTLGWALPTKLRTAMRSTPRLAGTASGFIWPDGSANAATGTQEGPLGYQAACTSAAYLANIAILGVWDQMLIGDWGFNEIISDNITGAPQGLFKIIEHSLNDINFRHIESFAASTSILVQ